MVVDIQNVSWERGDRTILNDLSWRVQPGEHWCLLGLNGSGKTTLLNMINGYIWPTRGSISILGKKFGETDLRELRKKIGWVSTSLQEKLYGSEKGLNIVLSGKFASIGLYEQIDESDEQKAEALMEQLGCGFLRDRAYNTMSQGERQRVLIGRALMSDPSLLILDEPCTGLDIFAREQLLAMIQSITERPDAPTILYVTHHVEEILPAFNHTLLVKKGEIYGSGETEQMLNSENMSGFFGVPVQIEQRDGRHWLYVKRI